MSTEQNKAIAAEFFARFTAGDIDGALNTMTEDVTWLIPGKPESSPMAGRYDKGRLMRLFRRMQSGLKDGLKMTVHGAIAEGDKVAAEVESYGELTNGRIYNQHYHFLLTFQDGKISAVREYLDTQHANDVWLRPEAASE